MNENEKKSSQFQKLAAKVKKNNGKLPRVEWFRVDINGATGTAETWHETGYHIVVKLQGIEGEYVASTIGACYGMKVKRIYKSVEAAEADGWKMKKDWGRGKVTKTQEDKVVETLKKMSPETLKDIIARLSA